MITIPLNKPYTCISSNSSTIAIGGKSGISFLNSKQDLQTINDIDSHKIKLNSSDLLGVCSGTNLEVFNGVTKIWSTSKHSHRIQDLGWSQNNLLASCSKDSKLLVWDIRTSSPAIIFNTTKGVGVYCLAWSHYSNEIIASGHDTALKLWDARLTKKSLATVRSAHPGRIISLDWHTSQPSLISTSLLSTIKNWKTSSASITMVNSAQTHFQSIKTLYTTDSSRVVYISERNDGKIYMLGSEDLKPASNINVGTSVEDVDWHNGSLAVLCADRTVRILSFDGKESDDRGESMPDDFDSDIIDCNVNLLGFEQEMQIIEKVVKEGINIEDYGLVQRYCKVRIDNKREFLRYMLTFPVDYPESPPNYTLQSCSKYLSSSVPDEIKRLENELNRKSKQLCRIKGFSIQKICDFLLNSLNLITDTDGYEDFNDFIEDIFETKNYTKNTPVSCIHAWHPSGELLIFTNAEASNAYKEFDEFFNLESKVFQAGIHAEKFGPSADEDILDDSSLIMKVEVCNKVQEELFKQLTFSGSDLQRVCEVNSEVCEKMKMPELAGIWRSFIPSLQLIGDAEYWAEHPLGLKFLIKLLKYFWRSKNYYGQVLTSIFCAMCIEHIKIPLSITVDIEFNHISVKDLMFFLLKELSEGLHRCNIIINSRAIMKMAGNLGYPQFLLPSESSLGFDVVHNYTFHSKNFCKNCNQKCLICAICLGVVSSLGVFCKACGHGGHLAHQQKWFYRESTCPAGCGCNCFLKMQVNSEFFFSRTATR